MKNNNADLLGHYDVTRNVSSNIFTRPCVILELYTVETGNYDKRQ